MGWGGTLIERTENRGGHHYMKLYGSPLSWMGQFIPVGRRVEAISRDVGATHYQRA
jgi:hypothetical protein